MLTLKQNDHFSQNMHGLFQLKCENSHLQTKISIRCSLTNEQSRADDDWPT